MGTVMVAVEPMWVGVVELVVVVGRLGGIVEWHGLGSFSTLHVKVQYAVKHQPAPSV